MLRLTAQLAAVLDLPFHSPGTAAVLTDKCLQRRCLNSAGVSPTMQALVPTGAEFETAMRDVGLPAVVKPRIGQSSADTFRCDGRDEYAAAVRLLRAGATPPAGWVVEEQLPAGRHPVVSWLGDYCSVESAVVDDHIWHFAVTDKLPLTPPFRESGDVVPTQLPPDVRGRVEALADAAIRAVGIRRGLVHTEVKLTPEGPRLIEVNGRLGGEIGRLLRRATGFDPVHAALELALGHPLNPRTLEYDRAAFDYSVMPPTRPVTVRALVPPSRFRGVPGVWAVERPARPGQTLEWRRGSGEVVFTVWADAPSVDRVPDVLADLDRVAADCVEYEPVVAPA